MILVRIFAAMREDQVGRYFPLQLLEDGLDFSAVERQEAIGKALEQRFPAESAAGKQFGSPQGLGPPDAVSRKHHPAERTRGMLFGEPEDCAAATDFDVVRMAAETQNLQRPFCVPIE